MWRRVVWYKFTNLSEDHAAPIIRVNEIRSSLKVEAPSSSVKSVQFYKTARRYIPENINLHNHRNEILQCHITVIESTTICMCSYIQHIIRSIWISNCFVRSQSSAVWSLSTVRITLTRHLARTSKGFALQKRLNMPAICRSTVGPSLPCHKHDLPSRGVLWIRAIDTCSL